MSVTFETWAVALAGLGLIGVLGVLQAVAIVRPRGSWTVQNVYGGSPDSTDPTAYFAFNQGYAWADAVFWAPFQVAGSIGMLAGERWGFLLALMASVPFWYTAIPIFIWDRDLGFRRPTLGYWVFIWGMFPAFGIIEGLYCFVRLVESAQTEGVEREPVMDMVWGATILVLGIVAWGGQSLAAMSHDLAVRIGLAESSAEIDPAFDADARGEARWDALTNWTLPLAGLLLLLEESNWAYFGLVGGSIYLYFGGRGIAQRVAMRRARIRIGSEGTIRTALAALAIWMLAGAVTIALAAGDLQAN